VPAHQVHELADADRAGVAVAADADGEHLPVRHQRAGADRRHAAVDRVEAVSVGEKIRRRLARAADPRQLEHLLRIDPHLEARVDYALGDRVVPAARAQRRLAAAIGLYLEADAIFLCFHQSSLMAAMPAAATASSTGRALRPSWMRISSVT